MNRSLPLAIGQDTTHATWEAIWSPGRQTDAELATEYRLGAPVAYWTPAVGLPGQWIWGDNSKTNAQVMPFLIDREPGGAWTISTDGGLTWHLATVAEQAALERNATAHERAREAEAAKESTSSGNSGNSWPQNAEIEDTKAEYFRKKNAQDSSSNFWGIMAVLGLAMWWDSRRRRGRR